MNKCLERLYNGIIKENPTFVLMLGMCPTLAVTTSAINGIGMGLTTAVVLVMSNMLISMLRKVIPDKVRMPAFIVVVASFVTIVQLLLEAYIPSLNDSLGIYIPLIVVNCIILGRAEAYASKNPVLPSIFDGLGMGLGFTLGLTSIGLFRELLGAGTIFSMKVTPSSYEPLSIFVLAPGAFFVLAMLTALQNKLKLKSATNGDAPMEDRLACGGNCSSCSGSVCSENHAILTKEKEEKAKLAAEAKKRAAAQVSTKNNSASSTDGNQE
ncbi:electron transport complex subunit RsxE [Clostridium sp. Marseille-P299]|uniref:electron transport complex subunit RsxE n=1 Tax=Clostridium sp. Marseille-P299 TaxID=1805477 RepID=UPI000833C5B2|nr:electron transport complex subunit E [Clostridium sp. Marseille-P299]